MGGGFLAFRLMMVLGSGQPARDLAHPGDWGSHAAAAAILLLLWLATRWGQRSVRYVQTAEALGIVGATVAYCAMGAFLPLAAQPHFITLMALTSNPA